MYFGEIIALEKRKNTKMDDKRAREILEDYIDDITHVGPVNDAIRYMLHQEPKAEWIPVSKELPKEGEDVLVWYEYFRYGDYNCMWQTYGIGWQYNGHFSVDNGGVKQRVIAWCELPKPYKESEGV